MRRPWLARPGCGRYGRLWEGLGCAPFIPYNLREAGDATPRRSLPIVASEEPLTASRQTPFERHVLASGLLTAEQLDEAKASLRWSGDEDLGAVEPNTEQRLADQLVDMELLNRWQASQLLEGRTKFNLGPYWIVDSIGQGGMGQVFKAEHSVLGRIVAIKVLPRKKCTPEAIESFMREIRAQARLDHQNLVRAFDAGQDGNVYYLVTEYVPGSDLRRLVRRDGALGMEEAASIIAQVAYGLEHAHHQGLIHRDVKPGNVLVAPDGCAKLSDLGLAGPVGGNLVDDPRFGKIVGTADYLSPDHIKAPWDATPAWDIYSLGCTLYYAVTGKVPFPGGSTSDKARAHCELRPLDPRRLNPELDTEFVDMLSEMMAKDPAERIPSAEQVRRRLAAWTRRSKWVAAIPDQAVHSGSDRSGSGPDGLADFDTADSLGTFPELPDFGIDMAGRIGNQGSQATAAVGSIDEETAPALPLLDEDASHPPAVAMPLVVLVFLPVALVFLVMFLWWGLRLL